MARRIINKAYNDLVGGAGTEACVAIGPEPPRNPSVLRLSSKDVSYRNRRVVEIKPADGRPEPNASQHPLNRVSEKPKDKAERTHFVDIDGSSSMKPADAHTQRPQAVPQTAYKMKSFMSSVELGPRRATRPSTLGKPPPPAPRSDMPKAADPPTDGRMFLPKGIRHSDQPYVVPKFMPTYREMMVPKAKPDPLVSIVERTPPSLQKWAVEWNAEPKKTISVDELKEDLIREAAERAQKPPSLGSLPKWESSIEESKNNGTHEDGNEDQLNVNRMNQLSYPELDKKNHLAYESRATPPRNDLHVPNRNETSMGAQDLRYPEAKQQKIGRPLEVWTPPKYNSPHSSQYSFKEAIKNGTPMITAKPDSYAETKLFHHSPAENVYFDTEEQKFHEWFKAKMSAAVAQSALNSSSKAQAKAQAQTTQTTELNTNTFSAFQDPPKDGNVSASGNSNQNKLSLKERRSVDSIQSVSLRDSNGTISPEVRGPEPTKTATPATSYEAESNSSFYNWLKLRGHHIAQNETPEPGVKKDRVTPEQNFQQSPKFPWSVSYTLKRRVSTPTFFPKRPTSKNLSEPHKIASQDDIRQAPSKNENSRRTSDNVMHHKQVKYHKQITSNLSIKKNSIKSVGKKLFKANSKPFVRSAGKKLVGRGSVKNSAKKTAKPESPMVPSSTELLLLNGSWKVDSEIDHVNNVRKIDIIGNSPKATDSKKNIPKLGSPQMKYWESKYTKKPKLAQKNPPTIDRVANPNPNPKRFRSGKATDGFANTGFKEILAVKRVDNFTGRNPPNPNFASIDEHSTFPLKLPQNTKDEVMELSEDFDVDNFLHEEEAVEKELLGQRIREDLEEGEAAANGMQNGKVKGKEQIKFPRTAKAHSEGNNVDSNLKERLEQKLNEDELLLALGEDPGLEDLEWSEFIGPKNSLEHDGDLTRLIAAQARQLSSVQNSCL